MREKDIHYEKQWEQKKLYARVLEKRIYSYRHGAHVSPGISLVADNEKKIQRSFNRNSTAVR